MNSHGNSIALFSGNSNRALAEAIAKELGISLSTAEVKTFSDGEISVAIPETVRGKDVFILQSTSSPVNNNLMELLIMVDAIKRASAAKITAVVPYFGYARQDRKARPRDPITAKLVANLIETAGVDSLMTLDLHAPQIQGFFDIPVNHLYGAPMLSKYYKKLVKGHPDDFVVVSPDVGSVARARNFANDLGLSLAIVDKRRPRANVMEVMNIIGDIEGKICLLVDDMIDTAGTIVNGAEALIKNGAKEVYACCSHGVLSGPAMERITNSCIKELAVLDTIDLPERVTMCEKVKVLSVAPYFAKAISQVFNDKSLSEIY